MRLPSLRDPDADRLGAQSPGRQQWWLRCSWLQKLDLAKILLVDKSVDMRPNESTLAPVYIYLQWISTGSIGCVEGGGHYRPNRHAELARVMFRSLEWVIGGAKSTPIERLTARRMQVCAPCAQSGQCHFSCSSEVSLLAPTTQSIRQRSCVLCFACVCCFTRGA
jgi:hypothetical protein